MYPLRFAEIVQSKNYYFTVLVTNNPLKFNKRIAHMRSRLQAAKEKLKAESELAQAQTDKQQQEWDQFQTDNDWQIKQDYER